MFSFFSISFLCHLSRLLVFPSFIFSQLLVMFSISQFLSSVIPSDYLYFQFLLYFPRYLPCFLFSKFQSSVIPSDDLYFLVFPSYLSCFLFSQFLSSVISADNLYFHFFISSQLLVMFSVFSISFLCHPIRLFVFLLVFPSYLSCFLFSQFLSSVIHSGCLYFF